VALLSSPLRPVGLPQVLSEAARRFGHVLEASGVTEALRQRGICEGDTVVMGEVKRGRLAPLHFSGIHNGTADYNLATLKGHSTRHGSAREEHMLAFLVLSVMRVQMEFEWSDSDDWTAVVGAGWKRGDRAPSVASLVAAAQRKFLTILLVLSSGHS